MTVEDVQEKTRQLSSEAETALKEGDALKAAEALKAASRLRPDDQEIKSRLLALQSQVARRDVVQALEAYFTSSETSDGERALDALQEARLSEAEASAILQRLRSAPERPELFESLTTAFVFRHIEARKLIATRFANEATELFSFFWDIGDEAFRGFATIPPEDTLWKTSAEQLTAQRDLFRLCVAKVIEAGVDHAERAMRVIARSLATCGPNVAAIIDDDVFDVVLSSLDIRLDTALRSQATVAAAKMLEVTNEKGDQMFAHFVLGRVAKQTNDDLIVAFSAAAATFPMIPVTATKLFMTDGFVQQLVPNLERNSDAAAAGKRKSRKLEEAALEMLSAACVEKSCREAINRYCSPWLQNLSEERDGINQALCTLILAKIDASSETDVTARLSSLVITGNGETPQAIEGLAYTSLQPSVKEDICKNKQLLVRLVKSLRGNPSTAFGCLTVFLNLTNYRVAQTEEQKKMAQLKAYANQSKPEPLDPLDNNTFVTNRCKALLEHDVVAAIVASSKQSTSVTIIALVVRILLSLSREQKHRSTMAQQGAIKLLLQIRERLSKTDKATAEAAVIERNASHALARLLISVNPSHVFSAAIPASSAVGALVPLLTLDAEGEQRDLLPTFEALLALTNLASMEDQSVHELQLRTAWEKIEDLLFSSNMLVQRASVELVCNLMASPSCVAKFADGSADAKRRVTILLALTDVEDLATRRAAGGALAMLTEWDTAVTALLDAKDDRGARAVLGMCGDDSDEIKHRGFVCLLNIVSAPNQVRERGVRTVKAVGGVEVVKGVLTDTKNENIMALGIETLQKLV